MVDATGYPWSTPPAGAGVQGRRSLREVHLGLRARRMLHDIGYLGSAPLDGADEAFDGIITVAETVVFLKILPDTLGAQSLLYRRLDDAAVRLTDACRAGGHFGRFWRPLGIIPGYRLPAYPGLPLNSAIAPAKFK
jgi:hypothetical protein